MNALPEVHELTAGQVRELFRGGHALNVEMVDVLAAPEETEAAPWAVLEMCVEGGGHALSQLTLRELEEVQRRVLEKNADFFDRLRRLVETAAQIPSTLSTDSSTGLQEQATPEP